MNKKLIAEFMGTFALVFCGTGAIVIDQETAGAVSHAGIAITFGLIVLAMIYAFGEISGAHFNPAVTLAFSSVSLFDRSRVVPYIFSQVAGALSASVMLRLLFPANEFLGATIPEGSQIQSLVLEFILTFILMLVILNVSHGSKESGLMAGIAIGSTVLLEAMFAGPVTGASMNPARSLAPALVSGHMESSWIYVIAPVAGAVMSAVIWKKIFRRV